MLDLIAKVTGPEIWRKVDVIKEARSIQVSVLHVHVLVHVTEHAYMYTLMLCVLWIIKLHM